MQRKVLMAFAILLVAPLLPLTGCSKSGPEKFEVSGVVTCSGEAVPTGQVAFVPTGRGKRSSGTIGVDGYYQLQAPAGLYKVTVIAPRETPTQDVTKENWTELFDAPSPPPYVPSLFGDPEVSPLSFTVEPADGNVYDIPIKKKRRRRR